MKVIAALLLGLIVIFGATVFYGMGVYNNYTNLTLAHEKQLPKIETFHDKMWKTIKSFAKIKDSYSEDFSEKYKDIMAGRYSNGSKDGSLMKWIQESNPQFTPELYAKMMTTIEAQRNGFFNEQDIMQGIVAEINGLVRRVPSSIVCYILGLKEIEFVPISSKVSQQVMETREDNELYLD